jgi:hypothetical protein
MKKLATDLKKAVGKIKNEGGNTYILTNVSQTPKTGYVSTRYEFTSLILNDEGKIRGSEVVSFDVTLVNVKSGVQYQSGGAIEGHEHMTGVDVGKSAKSKLLKSIIKEDYFPSYEEVEKLYESLDLICESGILKTLTDKAKTTLKDIFAKVHALGKEAWNKLREVVVSMKKQLSELFTKTSDEYIKLFEKISEKRKFVIPKELEVLFDSGMLVEAAETTTSQKNVRFTFTDDSKNLNKNELISGYFKKNIDKADASKGKVVSIPISSVKKFYFECANGLIGIASEAKTQEEKYNAVGLYFNFEFVLPKIVDLDKYIRTDEKESDTEEIVTAPKKGKKKDVEEKEENEADKTKIVAKKVMELFNASYRIHTAAVVCETVITFKNVAEESGNTFKTIATKFLETTHNIMTGDVKSANINLFKTSEVSIELEGKEKAVSTGFVDLGNSKQFVEKQLAIMGLDKNENLKIPLVGWKVENKVDKEIFPEVTSHHIGYIDFDINESLFTRPRYHEIDYREEGNASSAQWRKLTHKVQLKSSYIDSDKFAELYIK